MVTETPSPTARRRAAFLLWLANFGLSLALGFNYLVHLPEPNGPKVWLFSLLALVSSVLTLTLLPGLSFQVLARFWRSHSGLGLVQVAFWTVFQVLLFTDTRIYNIFRYHLNGQVLNLVYTRGSEDAIHLGWQVWTTVSLGLAAVGFVQSWAWRHSLRVAVREEETGQHVLPFLRPSVVWALVLLPSVFVEKTIYAEAELTRDHQLTSVAKLFPLYARVPVDELLGDARPPRVELDGVEIDYPLHAPRVDPGGARPNILILVIDCLRSDMLAPETMPAISDWADDARIFENHVSGGNSTRYGIFSMIYGLHGSYWFPFLQERRSPVLIDTLLDLGYEIGIFSSASMNYPELRDTAWVRVQDRVFDQHRSPYPWRKDELAAEEMTRWLEARESDSRPFFGFILLDAPHQTYSHPPDATWFRPSAAELDYMSMTQNEGPAPQVLEAVRNRYKNAVRHADGVASEILDGLARSSFADDTVVLVTGDHGEEFRECGFFGHTSAFTPWQVGVPLLVKGPGVEPGREGGPTSHHDIAPTLLEMLGAHPEDRGLWTLGENLFAPAAGRDRVISGWNELGVWTSHGILRVPMSAFEFDVELYDYEWRLQSDDEEITRAEQGTLERLGAECNRFLR